MSLRKTFLPAVLALASLASVAPAAAAGPPDAEIFAFQSIDASTVEMLGRINPAGSETTYRIQYDVDSSGWCDSEGASGSPAQQTSPETLSQTGNTYHVVSVEIDGLTPGITYCARITASNAHGSDAGPIIRFTTGAPAVQGFSAESTGATTGRVRGTVNPVNQQTQYWARYAPASTDWCQSGGDSGSALDVTTPKDLAQIDNSTHDVSVDITGLDPETEYCAQLVASNAAGTSGGDHVSFTTDIAPIQLCAATWDGGSGDWTDANWTFAAPAVDDNSDGYPDVNDGVCIPSGIVNLTSAQTVASVRVSGAARLDVAAALTVDDPTVAGSGDGAVAVSTGGTIQLTSTAAAPSGMTGSTLVNGGVVRTLAGAGGTRSLNFATIANGGAATLESNTRTTIAAFGFSNAGTITANGSLATNQHTTLSTAGHVFNQNAGSIGGTGTLLLEGGTYHHNAGSASSTALSTSSEQLDLDGSGSATVSAIKGTSVLSADVGTSKTVKVVGGVGGQDATLSLGADRTNRGTIVLTNSMAGDAASAKLDPGGDTLTNAGTFRTEAVGTGAGTRAISDAGEFVNAPSGFADFDYPLSVESSVSNVGFVDVGDGVTVTMTASDYVQTAGITSLEGQLDVTGVQANLLGGLLMGDGQVTGSLQNGSGTVTPGDDSPAQLTVTGNYTQGANGTLRVDVNGTAPGSGYDRLVVGGTTTLGGTLAVDAAPFGPAHGTQFTFVTSTGALSGTFATQTGTTAPGGFYDLVNAAGPPGTSKLVWTALHALTVSRTGNGAGTVTSPAGIDCGTDCGQNIGQGTVVTLTATPAAGSRFGAWSGAGAEACSGTTCQVTMSQARSVSASFVLQRALTVSKTGTGGGTVSGTNIDCGTDCTENYDDGTVVTLTATPAAGSRFVGWSGSGCTGTGTCQVTMSQARSVTANFAQQRTLSVARSGNGGGSVTGAGISCGTDCDETYDQGTVVTLTATPAAGSRHSGWSGAGTEACSGANCQVTMSQARSVTASFTQLRALTVTRSGDGAGSVSGAGIDCGSDCSETHDLGAAVTLTATPATGSRFIGWSGDCSGAATCQLTMSQARSVTATFTKIDDDGDGVSPPADCNDGNAQVKPGANDVPDNGVDEDCNGADTKSPPPPPADTDGDGVPDSSDPDPADPSVPGPFGSTNANDTLDATGIGETICGLLGNDVIRALAGNDTVYGDLCGVKAKLIAAQAGAGGNDTLSGGAGDDTLYGAGGDDKLAGDDGNDKLFGGAGKDSLTGGKGKDALDGGAGNDKLAGGADVNTYKGGAGDDTIDAKNGKKETVDCGAGKKDSASVDKTDKVKGCEKVKRARK